MDAEDAIHNSFVHGDLSWLGAVKGLLNLGYERDDASRMVDEWVDLAENGPPDTGDAWSGGFAEDH